MIPELIMLVGLPASGKSTYANTLKDEYIIHSSDALREELFGDINENSKDNNNKLFTELHKRIKDDLKKGNNVIYDATNINRKRRIAFLRELKDIPCRKTCVLVTCPYYLCLYHNEIRDRSVPEEVIKRMYMNFQPPHKNEGWDDTDIMISCDESYYKDYDINILYNNATGIDYFDQGNKHHSLTLGGHCRKSADYIRSNYPEDTLLYIVAMLHDEGKVFTKTILNKKGEFDGNCHYYQHHCVGAYNSIFYFLNLKNKLNLKVDDILYASSLIYFHMHPYMEWRNNKKLENKFRHQLGENLYNDIIALHKADAYAH